jgi:hypothetical protein
MSFFDFPIPQISSMPSSTFRHRFLDLTQPSDSRDSLDLRHSARSFYPKIPVPDEKVPMDRL